MKKPVDNSQNCACGACSAERSKYYREMEQYKKWVAEEKLKKGFGNLTTYRFDR